MPSFLDPTIPIKSAAAPAAGSPVGGAPSAASSKTLTGFTMQSQENGEWCWAAVTCSVAIFFGSTQWTQCRIASSELTLTCCVKPTPANCNVPWSLDTALSIVGHFSTYFAGNASFTQVQQEIGRGNPVGVRIEWAAGSAHFISIGGWLLDPSGTLFVDVFDPAYGPSQVDFSDLISAYRAPGDNWSHTYLTSPTVVTRGGTASFAPSPISA